MAALIWLIAGVLLIAAEVLLGDFTLVLLGSAALAAAGVAAFDAPVPLQVVAFAVVAVGLVTVARPALRRRLHSGHQLKTNVAALEGARAIVVATVDAHGGRVKLNGEVWSARAYDETQVLEPGRSVTVMSIAGATAVVWGEES
jgi:membrane protein implicated in regulation of membrane protease activity